MEIISIFENNLYSFKYDGIFSHEYARKLNEWQDFEFIYNKAIQNNIDETLIDQFFDEIFNDREYLKRRIENCVQEKCLFDLFKSLYNFSSKIEVFEASKAKIFIKEEKRLSRLRLYAIRANNQCFVITGGAIKFTNRMEEHEDTLLELNKIKKCRDYLIDNDFTEDDIIDGIFESI